MRRGRIPAGYFQAGPHADAFGLPTGDWPPNAISAASPYSNAEPIDIHTTPTAP